MTKMGRKKAGCLGLSALYYHFHKLNFLQNQLCSLNFSFQSLYLKNGENERDKAKNMVIHFEKAIFFMK